MQAKRAERHRGGGDKKTGKNVEKCRKSETSLREQKGNAARLGKSTKSAAKKNGKLRQ